VLALVWRRRHRRTPTQLRRHDAIAWALVVAIGGSAAVVNHLRDVRERELHRARALVEQHDYAGALAACDRADRWPSAEAPGRIDYIRAEAWWGLGNRQQAERYYLSSRRLDPTYFWTVADLAVFYASGEKPLAQRRRQVAPWLQLLESEFAGHPALARTLDRVRRRLVEQP
jgi:tetratricopeptide (TPR) repeat protein